LSPAATELANRLAVRIGDLDEATIAAIKERLEEQQG
jgi:hypothetical protein